MFLNYNSLNCHHNGMNADILNNKSVCENDCLDLTRMLFTMCNIWETESTFVENLVEAEIISKKY